MNKAAKYMLIGGAALFALDYALRLYEEHTTGTSGANVGVPAWFTPIDNALHTTPMFSVPVWLMIGGGALEALTHFKKG